MAKDTTETKTADAAKLQAERDDLQAKLAAETKTREALEARLAKLEAAQSDQATAIDKLAAVREVQAKNAEQVAATGPLETTCKQNDPAKALANLQASWSNESKLRGIKPPTEIKTKAFSVDVIRSNGTVTTVKVSNCYDQADAKRAALAKLQLHPRSCRTKVTAA